jgi:hypothetical protein
MDEKNRRMRMENIIGPMRKCIFILFIWFGYVEFMDVLTLDRPESE